MNTKKILVDFFFSTFSPSVIEIIKNYYKLSIKLTKDRIVKSPLCNKVYLGHVHNLVFLNEWGVLFCYNLSANSYDTVPNNLISINSKHKISKIHCYKNIIYVLALDSSFNTFYKDDDFYLLDMNYKTIKTIKIEDKTVYWNNCYFTKHYFAWCDHHKKYIKIFDFNTLKVIWKGIFYTENEHVGHLENIKIYRNNIFALYNCLSCMTIKDQKTYRILKHSLQLSDIKYNREKCINELKKYTSNDIIFNIINDIMYVIDEKSNFNITSIDFSKGKKSVIKNTGIEEGTASEIIQYDSKLYVLCRREIHIFSIE